MYVSPYLDATDVTNQKIVLKAFLSQQNKDNGCPCFKAFTQRFSIIVVTAKGEKYLYPFDCKQSPAVKGENAKNSRSVFCAESVIMNSSFKVLIIIIMIIIKK